MSDGALRGSARLVDACHCVATFSLDGRALTVNRHVFEVRHELHRGGLSGYTQCSLQEHEAGIRRERVLCSCKSPTSQRSQRGSHRLARGKPLLSTAASRSWRDMSTAWPHEPPTGLGQTD